MKTQLAAVVAALAVLAGCGGTDGPPVAKDPAPTNPKPSPHWPAEGCDTRSGSSIDYVADAVGADTLEEALAPYVPEGTSVVREDRVPHQVRRWLVVDADNEIVRAVSAFRGDHGWLVDGVEECSG